MSASDAHYGAAPEGPCLCVCISFVQANRASCRQSENIEVLIILTYLVNKLIVAKEVQGYCAVQLKTCIL